MDSSPGELESDRDLLIRNILPFLDPEAVRGWRSLSHEYDISVSRLQNDQLIAKRRIEKYLGVKLDDIYPNQEKQDWSLTYEIITSDKDLKPALWYTESEVDRDIVRRLGIQPYVDVDEMKWAIYKAAKTNMRIFHILFEAAGESLNSSNLESLIVEAILNNKQEVLDNPRVLDFIDKVNAETIVSILNNLAGNVTASPRVLDFFLTNARTEGINLSDKDTETLFDFVRNNQLSVIKILHKHEMMDPFKLIDGQEYVELDDDYNYSWSPFWYACKHGYSQMVKYFLEYLPTDEDIERDAQNYDLDGPISCGRLEIVRLLLGTGKVNLEYGNYLSSAVVSGNKEIVELLLAVGFKDRNLVSTTIFGHCLRIAVVQDYTEIAFLLLKRILRLSEAQKLDLISLAKYNMNSELERALRLHG